MKIVALLNAIIYGIIIIGICLIPIALFMFAWNTVVDYFNLDIPHIGMFISFMIMILLSAFFGRK